MEPLTLDLTKKNKQHIIRKRDFLTSEDQKLKLSSVGYLSKKSATFYFLFYLCSLSVEAVYLTARC